MKRTQTKIKFHVRWISVALILSLLFSLVGCGGTTHEKTKGADALITHVEVMIPNPTAPEAMVSLQGNIALQYYIEARMYLEKLSTVNAEEIDRTELTSLVNDSITAFENAEKMSSFLSSAVDLWMETEDKRDDPEIRVLHKAGTDAKTSVLDFFTLKAYAADYSASEMTAQAIVDAFDKAENGKKLKTLAELLGTDARHAVEQLKIAQAALEGADALEVAEQATKCIMVAKGLKTAGTVAGLVIAAAPIATGAVATMATGEMIATGGGIAMGAVNSSLEIISTGATLYCGTDENRLTKAADTVSDSKVVQTANMVVGLAGFGYNIKNVVQKADTLMEQGGHAEEYKSLLTSLSSNSGKEASDLFGIMSFSLGNINPDQPSLAVITPQWTEEGMKITLKDTEIGTSPAQQEAMKTLLKEAEFSAEDAEEAVTYAVKLIKEGENAVQQESDSKGEIPPEIVDNILTANEWISPSGAFDLDSYIAEKQEFMESLADPDEGAPTNTHDVAENEPADNANAVVPPSPDGNVPTIEEVCGTYTFAGQNYFLDKYQDDMSCTFSDNGDGTLRLQDDEYPLDAPYDASTGTVTFYSIVDVTITFTREDGKINAKMQCISGGELYGEYFSSKTLP